MQTISDSRQRVASSCPSPVKIWQTLLAYLLHHHYGLMLADTPFGDDRAIAQHINSCILLIDALNSMVEKYELMRTDRPGLCMTAQSPFITRIDILRARKACGLMVRHNYRAITDITTGHSTQERQP